jgi:ankyrin repeat protein
MSFMMIKDIRIIIVISFILLPCRMYSQALNETTSSIDTSGYIPLFYEGALDYNLMIASSQGYVTEIERLVAIGANINSFTAEGATPVIFAVSNNKLDAVKTLLKFDPYLDNVTSNYETPLLIAVKLRNLEISEVLIRSGADIDFPDRFGATPLHHAALDGNFKMVDLLLYYDASIDEKADDGTTPLLASIWAGYTDIADLLIQNGANLELSDNEGFTPFLMATFTGDTILMNVLYNKNVDIYAINKANNNALTLSILTGRSYVTEFLFRLGNRWDKFGEEALDPYSVAQKYRRKEAIKLLESNNIPGHIKYEFDQVAISVSSRFSTHSMYPGFSLALKEPFMNFGFIAGCDTKLWYTRILIKNSETLYYQYMDKGSVAYAGLYKDFSLTDRIYNFNIDLSASLLAAYSFGNKLKGTLLTFDNKFLVIPSISIKMIKTNFILSFGMEYIKTAYYHNGPIWLRLGCSYNLYFDKIRTKFKPIKWY